MCTSRATVPGIPFKRALVLVRVAITPLSLKELHSSRAPELDTDVHPICYIRYRELGHDAARRGTDWRAASGGSQSILVLNAALLRLLQTGSTAPQLHSSTRTPHPHNYPLLAMTW